MQEIDSLRSVIDSGYCIGCGACVAVGESVQLGLNKERQIIEPLTEGGRYAASVCPSIEVNYPLIEEYLFGKSATGPLGVVDSIFLAQSTNEGRNNLASSGGLIKEAVGHLLESGVVDGVIAIKHDKGLDYTAQMLVDSSRIDELPGSIYHNISYADVFKILLETDKKVALVALPCQLEGVYNFITKIKPELKEKVVFTVGLLCAWQYTRHSINAIAKYSGFEPKEITNVAYRGGGPIGKLRIELNNRPTEIIDRRSNINYQVAFDRSFNTPRCALCINHTNYFADLVVGDSWMQSTRFSKTGISIAIARSPLAGSLLKEMEQSNRLVLYQVTEDEVIESEGEALVYGSFAYSLMQWMDRNGYYAPKLRAANFESERKIADREVEMYFKAMQHKRQLLARGRYREIWLRKVLMEGHRILLRYIKWFVNRVLKLKKITGRDRNVKRADLQKFR